MKEIIAKLKKELAEARENELQAKTLGYSDRLLRWCGYQDALRRAIEIVEAST